MKYKVITGKLVARTAVHVGSGEGNDATDALIRRDTAGRPLIPGTAIAGALRGMLTRLAPRLGGGVCEALREGTDPCECRVCHLFGDVNPSDEGGSSEASRALVFNAELWDQDDAPLPGIRDGVGINRVTGAAARAGAVKFDLEVLPAGTVFALRIELRGTDETDEELLAAALAEWQAGRVWLGGRVARGLGAFTLSELRYATRRLDQKSELMAFLRASAPWDGQDSEEDKDWLERSLSRIKVVPPGTLPQNAADLGVAGRWVTLEGTLQAQGPLLTNDTTRAGLTGFDHAPLMVQLGDWTRPVLTGAGLRGVLRAHAERIARTLATLKNPHAEANQEARTWFLSHCPACDPNARRLGRELPEDERLPPLESCDSLLLYQANKGGNDPVEPETLCPACQLFGSTRFGSRLIVEDAPFVGEGPQLKMLDFLAVDRFTGGGAEGLKFDALALWKPAFKLRLHLDNPQPWELGWLALVLRDLAEEWLSVGYGAAKGFGRVQLTDWHVYLGYLPPGPGEVPASLYAEVQEPEKEVALKPALKALFKAAHKEPSEVYTTVQVDASQAPTWLSLAEAWVKAFNDKIVQDGQEGYVRSEEMSLSEDDYFRQVHGRWVNELYPREVKVS
jgi:CRISPR/Cas system CSM-associated protein Csm3 (group 7 of RAMP superfamily)